MRIDSTANVGGLHVLQLLEFPHRRGLICAHSVSRDGEHWTQFHALETEPGEYSYSSMIQSRDGALHITYTWRRQKVKHVAFPLSGVPKPAI